MAGDIGWKEALQQELEVNDAEAELREQQETVEILAEVLRQRIAEESGAFRTPRKITVNKEGHPRTLLWMFMYDATTPKLRR